MGSKYEFECESCGYMFQGSGGSDAGFACVTTTVLCRKCHKLYDIVISEEPWAVGLDWKPAEVRCPKSKKHECLLWEHPGPCPKCGQQLKRSEHPTIMWD